MLNCHICLHFSGKFKVVKDRAELAAALLDLATLSPKLRIVMSPNVALATSWFTSEFVLYLSFHIYFRWFVGYLVTHGNLEVSFQLNTSKLIH